MAFTYSAASAYTVTGAGTLASPYTVSTTLGNGMYTYSSNDLSFISSEAGTFYYNFSGSFTDGMTSMSVTIGGSSLYYDSQTAYSHTGSSVQASATTLLFSLYNMMGADWTFSGSIYFVPSSPTPTPTPTPTLNPNTIRIKRSSTMSAVPTTLQEGELSANIYDKKLWIGDSSKTPVLISDYNKTSGSGTVTSVSLTVPTGLSVTGSPVTTSGTLAVTLTTGYSIPTTASQTNWDSAYTQRLQWDGSSTNLVAATGRTSLGATTVGANMFTLTNPTAITFPRFNADNTVSALTAATFRTAIGAGTSSTTGTVTSIATTAPITGGTITGTGTIGINAASANTASFVVQRDASGNFSAGTITATLSGNASTATSATSATTATNLASGGAGQVPYNTASGATSFLAAGTAGQVLQSNATSAPSWTSRVNYTAGSSAPLNPVVGDHWYDTDDAALLVYINDGNTSQWVEAGSPSVGAAAIQSDGRLTLESGVPVSSTDQTAKTTVYYTPYNGNILSLYNGTSWNAYNFAELSLTTSGLSANSNYDIFAYVNGSTVTLEYSSAWTNDSTRFHALSLLNGVYVKGADTTRRYLGTIRTDALTQFTDSLVRRLVWNFNNRILRSMSQIIYTGSHTYNGGIREWNGGTGVTRMYFITGINGETFTASGQFAVIATLNIPANCNYAVDSTTNAFGMGTADDRAAAFTRRAMTVNGLVNAGFHYLTAIQSTESSGATNYLDVFGGGMLLC